MPCSRGAQCPCRQQVRRALGAWSACTWQRRCKGAATGRAGAAAELGHEPVLVKRNHHTSGLSLFTHIAALPAALPFYCRSPRGGQHRQGARCCGPLLSGHQGQRHGLHLGPSGACAPHASPHGIDQDMHALLSCRRCCWLRGTLILAIPRAPLPAHVSLAPYPPLARRAWCPAPRTLPGTAWRRRRSR